MERIRAAAHAAGRDPAEVQLVAVTKSVSAARAAELFDLGQSDLGENRTSALEAKHAAFLAAGRIARWHFVGHLQRNKARRVVRLAHAIHSVDSASLWEALVRLSKEEQRFPGLFLQVKLSDEPNKTGLDPAELPALVERARAGPLPLLGLMTLAPLATGSTGTDERAARAVFEHASALARALPASAFAEGRVRLSMGMSQDLEEAVRAGAHLVRVGSALFEGCGMDGDAVDGDGGARARTEKASP
ncbi:MAG: YggS family pyridoxal phosphate-dependent enzyme [Planctomycetes bacterium]|nr:YggS family pyridoxal phosphate-dependent enzyme [Planctomycetota bacterium]